MKSVLKVLHVHDMKKEFSSLYHMILNDSVIAFRVREAEAISYDMVSQIYNIMYGIIMLHTYQTQSGCECTGQSRPCKA